MASYFQSSAMLSDKMASEQKVGYQLHTAGPGYHTPSSPSPYWHPAVDVSAAAAAMTSLQPYGSSSGYTLMSPWSHRPDMLSVDYNSYESALTSGYDVKSWSNNSTPGGGTLPTGSASFLPLHSRLQGL